MSRVAIVVGGGSGIGAALGAGLVGQGEHVVLADIDGEAADAQARGLSQMGPGTANGSTVDVRDADALDSLVGETRAQHGRLDLMVNSAGIAIVGHPEDLPVSAWDRIIDVNLRGVIYGSLAAYRLMLEQRHGQILNVASLNGLVPSAGFMAPYAATKYGVVGFSLALRHAGAEHGVLVSVLCPSSVDTAMLDRPWPDDIPSLSEAATLREGLEKTGQQAYSPDELAKDALRGLDRDQDLIVVPQQAYRAWLMWRLTPSLFRRATADLYQRHERAVLSGR